MSLQSLAASALGDGASSLAKVTIKPEKKTPGRFDGEPITALFNPNLLRYENQVEWRVNGTIAQSLAAGYQRMEFQGTPPTTLTLDLFFDTYQGDMQPGASGLVNSLKSSLVPDNPFASPKANPASVTSYTHAVSELARVNNELHRPPICQLFWGTQLLIQGVLSRLNQDFTFFMPDGTPVRATLGCTFTQYRDRQAEGAHKELHSADVEKKHVVRRGDTLSAIAALHFNDATRWRAIADENGIDNPRALRPGQVLVIPKLEA
jgi:nucleoid-associated protein YgaU